MNLRYRSLAYAGNVPANVARILLIDDHPLVRAGMAAQIEGCPDLIVCGEAANASQARAAVAKLKPDVVALDLMLGDDDGLTLIRELRQLAPALRIVVLSMMPPETYRARALAAGADDFVHKTVGIEATIAALRGERAVEVLPEAGMSEPTATITDIDRLSDRELQVFRLIGLGRTSREISSALGISPKTVDAHKEHIKLRLGITNASQLTARAAQWAGGNPGQ